MEAWISLAGVIVGAMLGGSFAWIAKARELDEKLREHRREAYAELLSELRQWQELGARSDANTKRGKDAQAHARRLQKKGDNARALTVLEEAAETMGPELADIQQSTPIRQEALNRSVDRVTLVARKSVLDALQTILDATTQVGPHAADAVTDARSKFIAAARVDLGSKY